MTEVVALTEAVDLSEEESQEALNEGLLKPESRPYDPAQDREKIRGRIAQILIWLLVAIVALSVLTIAFAGEGSVEPIKDILDLVLTPIVGLVGAVTGFYFGEQAGGG